MRGCPSSPHSRTGPKLHEIECTPLFAIQKKRVKVTSLKSFFFF